MTVLDRPVLCAMCPHAQPISAPTTATKAPAAIAILNPAAKLVSAPKNRMTSVVTMPAVFHDSLSQPCRMCGGTASSAWSSMRP